MFNTLNLKKILPYILVFIVIVLAYTYLAVAGRNIICDCGYILFWAGDIKSNDNSQQITDPYTFHHFLHGLIFFVIIYKFLGKKISFAWQFFIAIFIEVAWELFENSEFIINRYRMNTLALGYNGDTIINSIFDVIACIIGFYVAKYIGIKKTLILFLAIELISLILIKDSLILNVIMLIYPIPFISNWQK